MRQGPGSKRSPTPWSTGANRGSSAAFSRSDDLAAAFLRFFGIAQRHCSSALVVATARDRPILDESAGQLADLGGRQNLFLELSVQTGGTLAMTPHPLRLTRKELYDKV